MKLTHYGAAVGLISLLISTTAFGKTNLTVNKADDFISQWVAIENQHSNLKKQWSDTKQLLNQRITLLTQEKKQLSALTSNNNKQVDEVTQARQKLLTLQTSIEAKQKLLTQWLADEFIQVNNTLAQLPPPLQKSWQSVLSEVDENNLSKQLESLLSLYQKYDEFNNRI